MPKWWGESFFGIRMMLSPTPAVRVDAAIVWLDIYVGKAIEQ